MGVHADGIGKLLEVAGAGGLLGLAFGLGQRGQQEAGQDRNDRDDDQQLDQRKGRVASRRDGIVSNAEEGPDTSAKVGVHHVFRDVADRAGDEETPERVAGR